MEKTKGYTLILSPEEHKGLKRLAVEKEKTMLHVILTALDTAYPGWRPVIRKENGLA
jgi:hypothetical protein